MDDRVLGGPPRRIQATVILYAVVDRDPDLPLEIAHFPIMSRQEVKAQWFCRPFFETLDEACSHAMSLAFLLGAEYPVTSKIARECGNIMEKIDMRRHVVSELGRSFKPLGIALTKAIQIEDEAKRPAINTGSSSHGSEGTKTNAIKVDWKVAGINLELCRRQFRAILSQPHNVVGVPSPIEDTSQLHPLFKYLRWRFSSRVGRVNADGGTTALGDQIQGQGALGKPLTSILKGVTVLAAVFSVAMFGSALFTLYDGIVKFGVDNDLRVFPFAKEEVPGNQEAKKQFRDAETKEPNTAVNARIRPVSAVGIVLLDSSPIVAQSGQSLGDASQSMNGGSVSNSGFNTKTTDTMNQNKNAASEGDTEKKEVIKKEAANKLVVAGLHALELMILAPLPYLLMLGLSRYVNALTRSKDAKKAKAELLDFKAFEVALLISAFVAFIISVFFEQASGSSHGNPLAERADVLAAIVGVLIVLVAYYGLLEYHADHQSEGAQANPTDVVPFVFEAERLIRQERFRDAADMFDRAAYHIMANSIRADAKALFFEAMADACRLSLAQESGDDALKKSSKAGLITHLIELRSLEKASKESGKQPFEVEPHGDANISEGPVARVISKIFGQGKHGHSAQMNLPPGMAYSNGVIAFAVEHGIEGLYPVFTYLSKDDPDLYAALKQDMDIGASSGTPKEGGDTSGDRIIRRMSSL